MGVCKIHSFSIQGSGRLWQKTGFVLLLNKKHQKRNPSLRLPGQHPASQRLPPGTSLLTHSTDAAAEQASDHPSCGACALRPGGRRVRRGLVHAVPSLTADSQIFFTQMVVSDLDFEIPASVFCCFLLWVKAARVKS